MSKTEEIKKQSGGGGDGGGGGGGMEGVTRKEKNRQAELYSKLAVLKNKLYYEEKQNV